MKGRPKGKTEPMCVVAIKVPPAHKEEIKQKFLQIRNKYLNNG